MPLTLRIQSYRSQPMSAPMVKRFDASGGSVGRTPENDLVLNDPSKYISRAHAKVAFRDGAYYLADTGSNPSMVNQRPLGNGREVKLAHGDLLTIGDYVIEVVVEAESISPASAAVKTALPPLPEPKPKPVPPLFQPPVPPAAQARPSAGHFPHQHDPLSTASILGGVGIDQPAVRSGADPLGLNLFGSIAPDPQAHIIRGAESDHVSPEVQAFPAAQNVAASPMAIPDDYDPLADYRPAAPPATVARPAAPTTPSAPTGAQDSAVLQALLKGMGLSGVPMNRPATEVAETVGAMLREAVTGTMAVLVARSMTKRESRIEMTMIASQANNPLKFFPDAQSALKQMLTNELSGYMPPVKSIGSAFDDLKAHELAVIAGMRAALAGVLQRFDPAMIEEKLKASSVMDMMLATNRKAKMWDHIVELYEDISREADDDFQRLFGDTFSAAYEEQINRLRRSGK
ncbi:MAG TPA: type VI secretion system-associated FHA domain protein TagH [Noviherbaspirillum sp.]|jgi:type VI secretion system FHA domain protein|uniref:type VI secretion system-associated FHA domain protein TagH n=1 Tax=Noviherbaspirillum sp. TaxID=1926288 RepID=UPI002DDCA511|nr:type VI secretion system-associated FHA domain protein TagH [Noviherbaspirillum sp.]HEV2609617.1 type VI secretion system-associated FHA domain protein TagH [Noviherbaspirillum sp.]